MAFTLPPYLLFASMYSTNPSYHQEDNQVLDIPHIASFFFLQLTVAYFFNCIGFLIISKYDKTRSHSSSSKFHTSVYFSVSFFIPPLSCGISSMVLADFQVHFPPRLTRQYSFAMYTRCIHHYINISKI